MTVVDRLTVLPDDADTGAAREGRFWYGLVVGLLCAAPVWLAVAATAWWIVR